ncbi:hypothetical protein [Altererythrobacter sp.]|uniref:hypothetical protein n=1 Tax=Altererythrobacter sp. TaxID=1872480 RepID=UPI001B2ABFC2|nr:hypothetical protein [Altererythrobacter sp.]MBO6609149.1 hypothetical protein [Altererythrobacter sp.]MBO6641324.1 hypothetical protein [Altererythrobacter sp.]MBO6707978.1 hypothetical protein [Altererythrobacter sp.]
MISTLFAFALVAQAQPAPPAEQNSEQTAEQVQEEKAEDKRICRRISVGMGSRKKERVCMTSGEWREFNRGN